MTVIGADLLAGGGTVKAVLNEAGIYVFPTSNQHRDMKVTGLDYQDESAGNALAVIISPGRVEIRGHRDFSLERVTTIWKALLRHPELADLNRRVVLYQGNPIPV